MNCTFLKYFTLLAPLLLLAALSSASAQNVKRQTDKHIINQQERMVYKSWDRKKFTPTKGFLGLNYQYWLTWAWHPNYPKTDLRPLRADGPQTLRMGLVLAMQNTDNRYKQQSDTIKNTAVSEAAAQAGLLSPADPLWKLYYERAFSGLLDSTEKDPLAGLSEPVKARLKQLGSLDWYGQEQAELQERLAGTRSADMDRGSRILAYHYLLAEYRKLTTQWKAKIEYTKKYLKIMAQSGSLGKDAPSAAPLRIPKTDIQIVNDILSKNH